MSTRPGIRNFPVASMMRTPVGGGVRPDSVTAAMRPSRIVSVAIALDGAGGHVHHVRVRQQQRLYGCRLRRLRHERGGEGEERKDQQDWLTHR